MKEENKINIDTKQACDACGLPIEGDWWVVTGSKKIIHHGGSHKDVCYRRLNEKHGA
jgi:hypothetical protein